MVESKASDEAGRNEVASAVLTYLQRHPNAADTLDGIVTWWLPQQRYETERQHIKRTLGEMVERGELRRDRLPDGAVLYALNHPGRKPPG